MQLHRLYNTTTCTLQQVLTDLRVKQEQQVEQGSVSDESQAGPQGDHQGTNDNAGPPQVADVPKGLHLLKGTPRHASAQDHNSEDYQIDVHKMEVLLRSQTNYATRGGAKRQKEHIRTLISAINQVFLSATNCLQLF